MPTKIIGYGTQRGSKQNKVLRQATLLNTETKNIASLLANSVWESQWKQIPDRLENTLGLFIYKQGVKSDGEELKVLESDDGVNILTVSSSLFDDTKNAINNIAKARLIVQARPKNDYIKIVYQNGNIAQTNIKILINIFRITKT